MTKFTDPDAAAFLRCRECSETYPWAKLQLARYDDDADPPEPIGTITCPMCENDTFDRQEGPTRVVREWTYRGRTCEVHRHYMGHYTAYVEFTDADREAGYHVEHETLHLPDGDTYVPHGGVTWVAADAIGFDCGHAFDVCVDDDGDPWGHIGRLQNHLYDTDDAPNPLSVNLWPPDDVAAELEDLADRLPIRMG